MVPNVTSRENQGGNRFLWKMAIKTVYRCVYMCVDLQCVHCPVSLVFSVSACVCCVSTGEEAE